jgi:hypothetical protein
MNNFADFVNHIFLDVPGCAQAIINQQLSLATREFLQDTEVWVYEVDPITIVDGTSDYELSIDYDAGIHRVLKACVNDLSTDRTSGEMSPADYKLIEEWTFSFVNTPDYGKTDGLKVDLVLRPLYGDVIDIPEWIWDRWGDGIVSKTKARLMAMPKKPWTDYDASRYHNTNYMHHRADAIRERDAKCKSVDLKMTIPYL